MAQLADALRIERFAVAGVSGGGPFALACAWRIPERLTSVGIFAGVGPLVPETDRKIAPPIGMMWDKAPKLPGVFRLQMKLFAWLARKYPKLYVRMVLKEFGDTERRVYERLNISELIQADRNEGFRQRGNVGGPSGIPAGSPRVTLVVSSMVYPFQLLLRLSESEGHLIQQTWRRRR